MFEIKLYSAVDKIEWDQFVDIVKNGTFLFKRDYMDYHSERFNDFSLIIFRKNKIYSVLPANRQNNILYSHEGLTYGGFLMSDKVTTTEMLEVIILVNKFLRDKGIVKVVYKPIPYIYHKIPAQEDLFAIFKLCDAQIIGRNISSTIYQNNKIKFIESRKSGIRKAINNNIKIKSSNDYESFWRILYDNLQNKYGKAPVHSLDEIKLLASRFPENIILYLAYKDEIAIAGTLLYITTQVIHTQYISANFEGKEMGALDLLFDYLINKVYLSYPVFDFGQSTENMGKILNESLIFQKEGFGGRGMMYDIYEYEI
ncbi:MAG: GNAT family N-acetyltransferase [Paludibacter sp.]